MDREKSVGGYRGKRRPAIVLRVIEQRNGRQKNTTLGAVVLGGVGLERSSEAV